MSVIGICEASSTSVTIRKALAIGRDDVLTTCGTGLQRPAWHADREQRRRRAWLERLAVRRDLNRDRHQPIVETDEVELFAVSAPCGLRPAGRVPRRSWTRALARQVPGMAGRRSHLARCRWTGMPATSRPATRWEPFPRIVCAPKRLAFAPRPVALPRCPGFPPSDVRVERLLARETCPAPRDAARWPGSRAVRPSAARGATRAAPRAGRAKGTERMMTRIAGGTLP
jgi:hypothetical protein